MRGGILHNKILLAPLEERLHQMGATVRREHYVRFGRGGGYVDLLAELGPRRIVCEAETTIRRVHLDLVKAEALGAACLLIVVPSVKVRDAAKRCLRMAAPGTRSVPTFVLTLPAALTRLERFWTKWNVRKFPLGHWSHAACLETTKADPTARNQS